MQQLIVYVPSIFVLSTIIFWMTGCWTLLVWMMQCYHFRSALEDIDDIGKYVSGETQRHSEASLNPEALWSLAQPRGTLKPHPTKRHSEASPNPEALKSLSQPRGTQKPHPTQRHSKASPRTAGECLRHDRLSFQFWKWSTITWRHDECGDKYDANTTIYTRHWISSNLDGYEVVQVCK